MAWRREGGRFTLDAALPDGLETALAVARDGSRDMVLIHNGRRVEVPAGAKSAPGVELSPDQIAVAVVGGRHHLELGPQ